MKPRISSIECPSPPYKCHCAETAANIVTFDVTGTNIITYTTAALVAKIAMTVTPVTEYKYKANVIQELLSFVSKDINPEKFPMSHFVLTNELSIMEE